MLLTQTHPSFSYQFLSSSQPSSNFVDVAVSGIYHGVDWLYTSVETMYTYDFKILFFWFYNSIYDESFDYFFTTCWYGSLIGGTFQLLWSYVLDSYIVNSLIVPHYSEYWFKTMLASRDISLVVIHHPELCLLSQQINESYFSSLVGSLTLVLNENVDIETILTPYMVFVHFLFVLCIVCLFITMYCSFFTSFVKEEVTIDYDYILATTSVEAEKEVATYDDLILTFIVVCSVVGWYFYLHCWTLISNIPEFAILWYFLPLLYWIIFGIPLFMLNDFGAAFASYLRGVGGSSLLLYELLYDFIALIIYFTRIMVQGVRIILVTFTYVSLNDFVLYFSYDQTWFLQHESFWDDLSEITLSLDSVSYFLFATLPGRLLYWMYELLHTFFVVTAQCVSFFVIVFWLFLFLYSFYVAEQIEDYLTPLRAKMRVKLAYSRRDLKINKL